MNQAELPTIEDVATKMKEASRIMDSLFNENKKFKGPQNTKSKVLQWAKDRNRS